MSAFNALDALQDFHCLPHINVGRAQQLGPERGCELVEFLIDAVIMIFKECFAGQ